MAPVCCCLFLRSWRFSCRVLLLPFVGVSSQCSLPQSRLTPALWQLQIHLCRLPILHFPSAVAPARLHRAGKLHRCSPKV